MASHLRNRPLSPRLVALEPRDCPSVAAFAFGPTLFVVGDNGADVVEIVGDGAGNFDASITGATDSDDGSFKGIRNVVVATRGGDDTVSVAFDGPVSKSVAFAVDVSTFGDTAASKNVVDLDLSAGVDGAAVGAAVVGGSGQETVIVTGGPLDDAASAVAAYLNGGDDSFSLTQNGDLTASDAVIAAFGGSGDDSLSFAGGFAIDADSQWNVAFDGGSGDDSLSAGWSGLVDGTLRVALNGGSGNDVAAGKLIADDASTGTIAAVVSGGFGNDDLTLAVFSKSDVDAVILGGPGTDKAVRTANVDVFGVEDDTVI